jgi:hypothetical protein
MQKRIIILILSLIAITFFPSCSEKESIPDVSHISVDLNIHRFDKSLMEFDTANFNSSWEALNAEYGEFVALYFNRILPLRNETPEVFQESLSGFIHEEGIQELKQHIEEEFGDFKEEEQAFENAFRRFKYYFPSSELPDLYTILSEYSYQLIEAEVDSQNAIIIGLDMFLGSDFPYEQIDPKNPAFSSYLTRRFNKDHLVKKTLELMIDEQIGAAKGDRMLDLMIHNGKRLYLLNKVLPSVSDTVIMEYSKEQLNWAENNEVEMWAFFFKKELFYKTNRMEINKYLNVSPNSPGMPMEAPGRTANYMGWKIIEAYMKRNPELSILELINNTDAQDILNKSRFKPKK